MVQAGISGHVRPCPGFAFVALFFLSLARKITLAVQEVTVNANEILVTCATIRFAPAYAVWAGIGTVLTALIGIFYFHKKATPLKICGITLIIAGVVMLNFSEAGKVGVSDGMESTDNTESSMEDMVDAAASGANGV